MGVMTQKRQDCCSFSPTPTRRRIVELLGGGRSMREAARQVGVSEGVIRRARRRGELGVAEGQPARPLQGPQARSQRDAQATGGVAVKRHQERARARRGQLTEAAPRFVAAEAVRYGGAWLALPALLTLGVLEAGEQTYGALKKAFYGLRSTLLILAFMALLRLRTPEQRQGHPPGELGMLLGLDRALEVKTLRRKRWELAARRGRPRASASDWRNAGCATRPRPWGGSTSTATSAPITHPPTGCRQRGSPDAACARRPPPISG